MIVKDFEGRSVNSSSLANGQDNQWLNFLAASDEWGVFVNLPLYCCLWESVVAICESM